MQLLCDLNVKNRCYVESENIALHSMRNASNSNALFLYYFRS